MTTCDTFCIIHSSIQCDSIGSQDKVQYEYNINGTHWLIFLSLLYTVILLVLLMTSLLPHCLIPQLFRKREFQQEAVKVHKNSK